jgi:hypothetical protein
VILKPDLVEFSRQGAGLFGRGERAWRTVGKEAHQFLAENPGPWDQRLLTYCQCCGGCLESWGDDTCHRDRHIRRCWRHIGRNPCAIEGCERTTRAPTDGAGFWYGNDTQLCGQHWRELVPPGSPERRVVNRLFRTARRLGLDAKGAWPEPLESRYWRVWARVVAIARGRAAGDIDEAEIRRMFGWEAEAA